MLGLRLPELLIILVVVVLVFGAKKLPELGDSLGKGIRAFKRAAEHGFDKDNADTMEPKSPGQLPQGSATTKPTPADAEKAHRSGNGPA
jgi:sec-independent protein translocase protein TatA